MTQPNPNQTTTTEPVVTSSSTPPETPATPTPEVKAGDVKSLPEWAQTLISNTRGEAANWRTQLREAQDTLGKAKSPEQVQAALDAMAEKNTKLERDLLVERIANKHSLPDDLKARLTGETEGDLEKDAASLAKYIPKADVEVEVVDPENLSGGLNPNDSSDSFDPEKLASQTLASRYS